MKPSKITAIGFKMFGGEANGSLVAHFPKTVAEVLEAIKAAKDFLEHSDTRVIEMQLVNQEGQKELHNLYKAQKVQQEEFAPMFDELACAESDPYSWNYGR